MQWKYTLDLDILLPNENKHTETHTQNKSNDILGILKLTAGDHWIFHVRGHLYCKLDCFWQFTPSVNWRLYFLYFMEV